MKRIYSQTAFTLLELIITTILVVIVILGIFSINSVLNNNNQDYGQRYLIKSDLQTTLNHILNNASLAVGSGTNLTLSDNSLVPDKGILIGGPCPGGGDLGCSDSTNNPNTFCIHQAAGNNVIAAANNDIWLCYTWIPASYQIQYCTMPYQSTLPALRGAVACTTNAANTNNCVAAGLGAGSPICTGPTYLGNAFSLPTTSFANGVFSISLENCLNDAANPETCNTNGISSDPVNNPEVLLSGSVSPAQEGI